jgi:hypothetical protein
MIPLIKGDSLLGKYIKWSFNNATSMLVGKKYNKLSIPNNIFWMSVFTLIGMCFTKEQAEKSWKKLYK